MIAALFMSMTIVTAVAKPTCSGPDNYWDDWLRGPENRKGREILRPEIPRTLHYGTHGTSNNQFGSFLSAIVLHSEPPAVDWTKFDLDAMRQSTYEASYIEAVRNQNLFMVTFAWTCEWIEANVFDFTNSFTPATWTDAFVASWCTYMCRLFYRSALPPR